MKTARALAGSAELRNAARHWIVRAVSNIHGDLLKLGIDIGETSVSKYMVHRRKPPSKTWRTFLANHLESVASVDFFTVPTIRFQLLYRFR